MILFDFFKINDQKLNFRVHLSKSQISHCDLFKNKSSKLNFTVHLLKKRKMSQNDY